MCTRTRKSSPLPLLIKVTLLTIRLRILYGNLCHGKPIPKSYYGTRLQTDGRLPLTVLVSQQSSSVFHFILVTVCVPMYTPSTPTGVSTPTTLLRNGQDGGPRVSKTGTLRGSTLCRVVWK